MDMNEIYAFHYFHPELGLCRDGEKSVLKEDCHTFLIDDTVNAIKIRMPVSRLEAQSPGVTIRKKVVMYRDCDCKDYAEAYSRYENWKYGLDEAKSMSIDTASAKNIEKIYRRSCEEAAEALKAKVVCQHIFEYSMPSDLYEDTVTLTLPITPKDIEPDTLYRLAVVDVESQCPYRESMPCFVFFRCDKDIEQVFIPCSASLRVRPNVRGKLLFDKATRYRHYNDFFADIHYDEICEEVEVNPVLVCFEIKETQQLGENYGPEFTITLNADGKKIHKERARLLTEKNCLLAVFAPIPGECLSHVGKDGAVTAILEVLNHDIAHFDFNIKQTEEGEYTYKK